MNTMTEASEDLKTLIVWINGSPYFVNSHKSSQPIPITDGNDLPVTDPEVVKIVKREARFYLHNVLRTTFMDYTEGI